MEQLSNRYHCLNLCFDQDFSDTNKLKRAFPAFPVKPPSESYRKEYTEPTDVRNELYDYEERHNIPPAENPPFQRKIWRRMGQTIDRQFQALAGGAQVNIFSKKIYLSNDLVKKKHVSDLSLIFYEMTI